MFSLLIAVGFGALTGLGLYFGGVFGIGWSIGWGFIAFIVAQVVVGRIVAGHPRPAGVGLPPFRRSLPSAPAGA